LSSTKISGDIFLAAKIKQKQKVAKKSPWEAKSWQSVAYGGKVCHTIAMGLVFSIIWYEN